MAFAAVHQTMRYRGEDTGWHVLALDDRTMFVSRRPPRLYDAAGQRVPVRELSPGSYVNVRYSEEQRRLMMEAVQLVREPAEELPFPPVLDDGHL